MSALRLAVPCLTALLLGCAALRPSPTPAPEPGDALQSGGRVFIAERAYEDVRRLVAIGPRRAGTEGAARAREYLRGELVKLGLVVDQMVLELPPDLVPPDAAPGETPTFVHLFARIPGRGGRGEILLAAGYDTAPGDGFVNVAANGAASGPAVVLELARAIAAEPLEYDTRVAFIDGDQAGSETNERVGSRVWARTLRESGELDRMRLALTFRQVCDPDLRFERDLFSNRAYREAVWRAGRSSGHADAFAPDAEFGTPSGIHHSLIESGMRRVVAVVDDAFGGTESPGALAGTADDDLAHCSEQSLAVTGAVALEALADLTRMLSKVDRLLPPEEEPEAVETVVEEELEADAEALDAEPPAAEPSDVAPAETE